MVGVYRSLEQDLPPLGLPLLNNWHQRRSQRFGDIFSRVFFHVLRYHAFTSKQPKRPRDPNLLARSVVEDLIGEKMDGSPLKPKTPEREKNPAAVALSKLGASKGGQARAASLSASKRKMIAKKAAAARWKSR
jgi:hypothetical protein